MGQRAGCVNIAALISVYWTTKCTSPIGRKNRLVERKTGFPVPLLTVAILPSPLARAAHKSFIGCEPGGNGFACQSVVLYGRISAQ